MNKSAAHKTTPQSLQGKNAANTSPNVAARQRNQFFALALTMAWQLAVVVLVPIIGGVFIDRHFHTSPVFLLVGLALALGGTILVLWRTMQAANQLPVPKLTDAERREIQKRYEEDDD